MKAKKPTKYKDSPAEPMEMKEAALAYEVDEARMIRTQIYLSKIEYDFVQSEAGRRREPMAAVIRSFIDEKMEIPADAWTNNPMLEPTPIDPNWESPGDAAINHDHYLYGCPKKWIKVKGEWVESPPLPGDYYGNKQSRKAYDEMLRKLDESQ
jgi:hypothetical protein